MTKKRWEFLVGGLILVSAPAFSDLDLNGFATIAGGMSLTDDAELYGYDDKGMLFNQDSLFGIQVSADLGEGLKATAQVKSAGENDWDTKFEWAYLSYEVSDKVKVLFGRQRQPFYMYSDFLDVGYAYHWIIPPQGVYNLPFDSVDGLGLIYTDSWKGFESTVQANMGRTETILRLGGEEYPVDAYNSMSLNGSLVYNWLTLRAGYTQAKLDMPIADIEQLADGWSALSLGALQTSAALAEFNLTELSTAVAALAEPLNAISEGVRYEKDDASFSNLGFIVDYERFLVVGEVTRLDLGGGMLGINDSGYLSFGFRINEQFLPHITWGKDKDRAPRELISSVNDLPQAPTGGVVAEYDTPFAGLRAATQSALMNNSKFDSTYTILGLRWDFHPSAAFKAEFINRKVDDADKPDDSVNLLRFAVSTVF